MELENLRDIILGEDVMAAFDPLDESEPPEKRTEVLEPDVRIREPRNTRPRTDSAMVHYAHRVRPHLQFRDFANTLG